MFEHSINRKSLEILQEIAPNITRAALMFIPDNPATVDYSGLFKDATTVLAIHSAAFPVHQCAAIERVLVDLPAVC